MNRAMIALLAAAEAALVVAIGVGIPLVASTLLWALQFGFAPEWPVYWRGAADVWLIGHGVDVRFTLDPGLAAALGAPGAGDPFVVTVAALGFALLTAAFAARAGRRIAETSHRFVGEAAAIGVFAVLAALIGLSAAHPAARPSLWQSALLPTVVFTVGLLLGSTIERVRHPHPETGDRDRIRELIASAPELLRVGAAAGLRMGVGAAALVVTVSALAVGGLLLTRYAEVIELYEALHVDALGGIALTLTQLALVPNAVAWAASWFTGPGFAIGAGSSIGPLGTATGPMPALPLLGALPTGEVPFGFAGIAVPVAAALVAGALAARSLRGTPLWTRFAAAALGAAVGGLLLGVLTAAASGAAGPGRLAVVGADPLLVGGSAALEILVGAIIGVAAASARAPREGAPGRGAERGTAVDRGRSRAGAPR